MSASCTVSPIRTIFRDAPLGYLMAPTVFAWVGTVAMAAGFSFGRRGRANGPELFPAMLTIACILTTLVMIAAIIRYRRFKAIARDGVEIEGHVGKPSSQSGLATIRYSYTVEGEKYRSSHSLPSIFCPSSLDSTVVVDKTNPKRSFLRNLYCSKAE